MATIGKLPSGRFRARYYGIDGKQRSATFDRKMAAKAWAEEREAEIRNGTHHDPRDGRMRFQEWFDRWTRARGGVIAKSTRANNLSHAQIYVLPKWGAWPLQAITRMECQNWVAQLVADGHRPDTVHKAVHQLSGALKAAVDSDILSRNPAARLRLPVIEPKDLRILTDDETGRLLAELAEPYCTLTFLALKTGMRWAEIAGLGVHNLDMLRRQLRIVDVLERDGVIRPYPKGKKARTVPLTSDVVDALAAHLAARPPVNGLVFNGARGAPLDYGNTMDRHWRPGLERAGIQLPTGQAFHVLRHTYGTNLAADGVPQHVIQELMGHRDARTTGIYMHAGEADYPQVIAALERAGVR